MKTLLLRSLLAAVFMALILAPGCASSGPATPEKRSGDPAADLAGMLSGRFEGTTPGNKLILNIQSVVIRSLEHPYDLFLEVSGRFEDTNVHQDGYLHLANQGSQVAVGYIPHFNPAVSALSPGAGRFTASEVNAACGVYFQPQGDGYMAETVGSTTCAFAIRGAIGKWEIRVEPGTITLRNEQTGETLRFKRVARS